MGGGFYSDDKYAKAAADRAARRAPEFEYDKKVKAGLIRRVHPDLDPLAVAGPTSRFAGKNIRESRDSAEHPASLPVIVIFDVTGSMGKLPMIVQKRLCGLMGALRAVTPDPHVLVGAVGDATCDRFPIQVGQFESDNRVDEQLRNIILEGGGGGGQRESYALAYYFAADHTAADAYDVRGKKGYLFTMGDEAPYPSVTRPEMRNLFGDRGDCDESFASILKRVRERWHIRHLFALDGSYPNEKRLRDEWEDLIGPRALIMVKDSSTICEVICREVAMREAKP